MRVHSHIRTLVCLGRLLRFTTFRELGAGSVYFIRLHLVFLWVCASLSVCFSALFGHQVKGHRTDLKLCRTCEIYRPPRAVHCSECNNCVGIVLLHTIHCLGMQTHAIASVLCCYTRHCLAMHAHAIASVLYCYTRQCLATHVSPTPGVAHTPRIAHHKLMQ